MNNSLKLFLAILLILSACNNNSKQVTTSHAEEKQITAESGANTISNKIVNDLTITSQNIGEAKIGMTLGELKQLVSLDTEFQPKPEFMVDINAIAVKRAEEIKYYLVFPAREKITDNSIITYLVTQNPQYQTEEKVRVGLTIAQAEAIYGKVSLAYNVESESREYLQFPEAQLKNIRFRPNNFDLGGFAGIYAEQTAYNQTEIYHEDSKIAFIEVVCPPIDCLQP